MNSKRWFLGLLFLGLVTAAFPAFAIEKDKDGWFRTGDGIRMKSVAIVSVKVYAISHFMKELPPAKSKQTVIDANVSKRIVWQMLRDVDAEKIQTALSEGYAMNGYGDQARIQKFVGAFRSELKEKSFVTITYSPESKSTTVSVSGAAAVTVDGVDFMKATWRLWFGKIDQPSLGDSLISQIP